MSMKNISNYLKWLRNKNVLLGIFIGIAGILFINTWFCFLPLGQCKQSASALYKTCSDWSDAKRNAFCGAKNGYVRDNDVVLQKESEGFLCEKATVALNDVCCPDWYYCTHENCAELGYDLEEDKNSGYFICDSCTQGNKTFYRCAERPCNYDTDVLSTLDDECTDENNKYCLQEKAHCGTGFQWVADASRKAGSQLCGRCLTADVPCEGCIWEEDIPSGCVNCMAIGEVAGKTYYKCTDLGEYNIPETSETYQNRDVVGNCNIYEGPMRATGRDHMNCYKEIKRMCGSAEEYFSASCPFGSSTTRLNGCFDCKDVGTSGSETCWECKEYEGFKQLNEWDTDVCYDETKDETIVSWDDTVCVKRVETPCVCPADFPETLRPQCFTEINGSEEEGVNIRTMGNIRCYKKVVPSCPEGQEYDYTLCRCLTTSCPAGTVSFQPSGCYTCTLHSTLYNETKCYSCQPMEGYIPQGQLPNDKCFNIEGSQMAADGGICIKARETECFCPEDFPEQNKPTCFNEIYGDDAKDINTKVTDKGSNCYRRINKVCLDQRKEWSDEECRCVQTSCPADYPLSALPDTCQVCEKKIFDGIECYKCSAMKDYKPASEWTNQLCYDETQTTYKPSASGTKDKCVHKVVTPCKCPATHPYVSKPNCFDVEEKRGHASKYIRRIDGVTCYSAIRPTCNASLGEKYNTDTCMCKATVCTEGVDFDPKNMPRDCRTCVPTDQILSNGRRCYICTPEISEAGYSLNRPSGTCYREKQYTQEDQTITCYKSGNLSTHEVCELTGYSPNPLEWNTDWLFYHAEIYEITKCEFPEVAELKEKILDTEVSLPFVWANCTKGQPIIDDVAYGDVSCRLTTLANAPVCPTSCAEKCEEGTYRYDDIPNKNELGADWYRAWIDAGTTACGETCYMPATDCTEYTADTSGCKQCFFKKYCGETKYYECSDLGENYAESPNISSGDGWVVAEAGIIENGKGKRRCYAPRLCEYSDDCQEGIFGTTCTTCTFMHHSGNGGCYKKTILDAPRLCPPGGTPSTNGNDIVCAEGTEKYIMDGKDNLPCGTTSTYSCYGCR